MSKQAADEKKTDFITWAKEWGKDLEAETWVVLERANRGVFATAKEWEEKAAAFLGHSVKEE